MSIILVNNSVGKPNWTQLKDRIEPLASCNVAAFINAAQASGEDVMAARKMGEERPADDLMSFIRADPDCLALYATKPAADRKKYPPNQYMDILALGGAKWLGYSKAFKFDNNANPLIMSQWIIAGGNLIVSGRYPVIHADGSAGFIDHITALVGLGYINEGGGRLVVQFWLMDDSYGDHRTKYTTRLGDNIVMSQKDFDDYLKENGSTTKRCIFVPKKGE
jgi:hypothetical protein